MQKKIRILIADDDPTICATLKDIFTEKGFLAETVRNGYELLSAVKRKIPHIIILDLMMPEKDGITVISSVKSICKDIKIVIYTGFKKYADSTYAKSVDKFLLKGENPEKIVQAINELAKKFPQQENNLQ